MKSTLQKLSKITFIALFILFSFTLQAQVKVYENFEYTAGQNLSTQNGGLGFSGPWDGDKNGTLPGGGTGVINAANLDGNTLGGSADLGGQWTERYRDLSTAIPNAAGTSVWVAFSYKITAAQEYSGLSLFDGGSEHLYIGRGDNDLIILGGGSAIAGGVKDAVKGTAMVTDMHYYLAKINFLGGSNMKVSLWADYTGTIAPDENDLTFQATAYYDNAPQATQLRIAGSCPTVGALANFDGIRISTAFFEKSNYTLVQSDVTAPTVPTGLVSSAIAITSCTLSWTASTDAVGVTGYDVFKDGVLYGATATTMINITGLAASTTYNFTVKAKDAAGNLSAASTGLAVTTLVETDVTAPTIPTNLTSSAISISSFTLSWTASTDALGVTGYDVFKDGVSYGSSATNSINVTGLTPATTYNFTVKAKDAAGNISVASAGLNVTTLAIVVPVVKVYENFEYTAGQNLSTQNGGLGFSGPWDGDKNGTLPGGGTGVINAANLDGNTLGGSADLGGQWTERYRDLSTAIPNAAGTSVWVAFSYKITAAQEYSGLSLFDGGSEHLYIGRGDNDLIILGGGSAIAGGVKDAVKGTAMVTDMHYYLAKINFLGGSNMKVSLWADYTGTIAPDENDLTFQATAYYDNAPQATQLRIAGSCPTVGALANFDGIRISSAFFARGNFTLPVSLLNFDAAEYNRGVNVSWKTEVEINSKNFIVERKGSSGLFSEIGSVASLQNGRAGNTYQFFDANPFIGNNYYRLKMVDIDGKFTFSRTVNIISSAKPVGILLYPNPVSNGVVNIVLGNEPVKSIAVINLSGIRVLNTNYNITNRIVPLNVSKLPKGVYALEIITQSSTTIKQLIIK